MSDDAERRLTEIIDRHHLPQDTAKPLLAIIAAIASDERAPTSVREPSLAVDVHIADALVALEVDAVRSASRAVDLGAGAGIPGLPLAVAVPDSTFTLIESQSRKCAFIERAKASATVSNAQVVCTRVEEWRSGIGDHDLALARAVASAPVVLEYAAPLLELGGILVDWRGRRSMDEERRAGIACQELGLVVEEVRHVQPYRAASDHHLHIYRKVAATPERYPRRVGAARKRPLGGLGSATGEHPDRA